VGGERKGRKERGGEVPSKVEKTKGKRKRDRDGERQRDKDRQKVKFSKDFFFIF
jgi:hypothetical protein